MNLIRPVSAFQAQPQNSQISQNFQKQNGEISRQKNNNQSKTFIQNNQNKSKQITQQSPYTQRARPKKPVEITEFSQIVDEETQKALESPLKSKRIINKVPLIKENDDKDINLLDVFRREFRSNTKQKSGLIAQAQRHNFNPARFYMRPEKKDEYFSQYLDTHDNNMSILQQKKLLKQQINLDLDPKIDLSQQISNLFETLQNQNLSTNQGDEQEQNNKINAIQSQKEKKRPQTCNNNNNVKNQRVQNLNQGQNVKKFGVYKTSLKPKTAQPKQQRSQSFVSNVENQNQNLMSTNKKYGFDSIIQSQRDWQTYDVDQQQVGNLKTSQNRKSTFARINSASTDSQLRSIENQNNNQNQSNNNNQFYRKQKSQNQKNQNNNFKTRNSILTNYQTPNLLSSEIKVSLDQNAPQI
ncbi:hypothetical protein PPERSA_06837 [Pseudocohnilembus persalinus]|uniref:Uncharacterized protein n=1 Tax=Pseudocohnilembus persalinus TaxID=266149 RepID=A0A0V0QSA1_PSEPJ|nr:hypothetical protein PPERSA_06837 [Pseudocohnilembus persalinus]|eukprot:KRX05203.1 hypothetical protein PPERSA_06837 [Pseudocohnilembus persalinus]